MLVVGGGVAGMTLAIQLTRRGIACHLVEIDPHWKPVGAGLTLNGATLRAFQQLGVLQAVRDQGHIHGGRRVLDLAGNILREIPAYAPEPNDLTAGGGILRPVLHAILSQETRAAGVELSLGLTIESLHDDGNGVEVAFNDGSAGRYDLVVGADG